MYVHIKERGKLRGGPICIQLFPDYFGATKQLKRVSHFKNQLPSALACVHTKNEFENKEECRYRQKDELTKMLELNGYAKVSNASAQHPAQTEK